MGLTLQQQRALAINPHVSGFLSVICSGLVVFSVLRDPRKRARIYHRLIAGICLMDMSLGFWAGLATWPIPSNSGLLYAVGNMKTCELQGFSIQFGISSSLYSVSLSIYYLLSLKYNWSERDLQRLEPFLHSVPLVFAAATATMGIPLKLYNNSNLWCWIAPYPGKCLDHSDCIRGAFASNYRWAFWYGPLWTCILLVTFMQMSSFLHVRKMITESIRRDEQQKALVSSDNNAKVDSAHGTDTEDTSAVAEDGEEDELNRKDDDLDRKTKMTKRRLREIGWQCFLYAFAFYVNWVCLTYVRILQAAERPVPYGLLLAAATITPLQGVPILIIYCYPRFLHERRTNPHAGILTWMKNSLL